jgi:regulator of cell morphogenesis and NO signaling
MDNVRIDVTILEPKLKHATIFTAFDNLAEEGSVLIHNDHDPKPLYYQLLAEKGNCFSWTYLLNGPSIWEIEIKKHAHRGDTIGEIAAKDNRKAEILKRLGLDFARNGKRSLEDACHDKGLNIEKVKRELQTAEYAAAGAQPDFNTFTLSFLADYIVNVHHSYVNKNLPMIEDLAEKVAEHHGTVKPAFVEVYKKVNTLRCELLTHLKKEEQILFPTIKLLEDGGTMKIGFDSIRDPIFVMESDHEVLGELIREIRRLTTDYSVPEDGCNSVKMLFHKLDEFEKDLLQHFHLENNILFPKAIALEK